MTHPAYQLDWNLIRTFTAIVEAGSMAAAARELGLTYPTVARHVQSLEDDLQLTLFDRTSSGMTPSIAGLELAASARDMRQRAAAFETTSTAMRSQPSGSVRITASNFLTQMTPTLLAPLRDWAHENSATVEVVPTNVTLSLLDHDADIALRHARPTQADLVCRKVAELPIGLWATPDYIQAHTAADADDAMPADLLYIDGIEARFLQRGAARQGIVLEDTQFIYRTDCLWSQLNAARSGWGVTTLPAYLADQYDDLAPVWPGLEIPPLDVWMVARRDMRDNPLHRRVFDQLADLLAQSIGETILPAQERTKALPQVKR